MLSQMDFVNPFLLFICIYKKIQFLFLKKKQQKNKPSNVSYRGKQEVFY